MQIGRIGIRRWPVLLLFVGSALCAQENPTVSEPPIPKTLDEAAAQREQASRLRREADDQLAVDQAACYKKFLVNDCLDDAKKRHTEAIIAARKLDIPARDFQREAHRAEVEAKEAKRAAELPQRQEEQQAQGETYRTEEAKKAAEREKKLADKEAKAIEGRQKMAADQAKHQAKLAKHAKEIAERQAKRAKKAAQ